MSRAIEYVVGMSVNPENCHLQELELEKFGCGLCMTGVFPPLPKTIRSSWIRTTYNQHQTHCYIPDGTFLQGN